MREKRQRCGQGFSYFHVRTRAARRELERRPALEPLVDMAWWRDFVTDNLATDRLSGTHAGAISEPSTLYRDRHDEWDV